MLKLQALRNISFMCENLCKNAFDFVIAFDKSV